MASHGIEITEGDPAKLFKIVTKLGEGSYGSVYSAIDLRDNTEVAIKVLEVDQADIGELRKEVNILKTCSNQYIVGYRGCWEKGKYVWIVMEYCAGGSLGDLLLLCNIVLDEQQARAVLFMTLHGLVYLHHRKLIHRDIKAANILLTRDGICKLGDFGVSAELTSTMAKRKTAVGTPYWMAPEMLASSEYDSKADVWSLAITLIELCSGEPPHAQQHPMRVLFLIPTSPSPTIPDAHLYSANFNNFLSMALQKDPAERWDASRLLTHPWLKDMTSAVAQTVVKRLVTDSLADIDACREQERIDNGWTSENIIATSNEQNLANQGNPNATFKPDQFCDNLSVYPESIHPDAGGDTMVIAPSLKAAIQNQANDTNADVDCGTTVLHQDVVQQVRAHAQSTSQPPPPATTAPSITVRGVTVVSATPTATPVTINNRSPLVGKHSTHTMVIKDDSYKDLLARQSSGHKQLPPPNGLPKLPVPPPPSSSSQYVHRSGAQTPHNITSQQLAPIQPSANVTNLASRFKQPGVGPQPTTPNAMTSPRGETVFNFGNNGSGGMIKSSTHDNNLSLCSSDLAPVQAAHTTVAEVVSQLRQQSCGDVAQMMKALEQKRKADEEALRQYYALAKKEMISNAR